MGQDFLGSDLRIAEPGMVADLAPITDFGQSVEGVPVAFGAAVVRGSTQGTCALVSGPGQVFFGVAMSTPQEQEAEGGAIYKETETAPIMRGGHIYVRVEQAVVPGDMVYYRHTANGPLLPGGWRRDDDTGRADRFLAGQWLASAEVGEIAKLSVALEVLISDTLRLAPPIAHEIIYDALLGEPDTQGWIKQGLVVPSTIGVISTPEGPACEIADQSSIANTTIERVLDASVLTACRLNGTYLQMIVEVTQDAAVCGFGWSAGNPVRGTQDRILFQIVLTTVQTIVWEEPTIIGSNTTPLEPILIEAFLPTGAIDATVFLTRSADVSPNNIGTIAFLINSGSSWNGRCVVGSGTTAGTGKVINLYYYRLTAPIDLTIAVPSNFFDEKKIYTMPGERLQWEFDLPDPNTVVIGDFFEIRPESTPALAPYNVPFGSILINAPGGSLINGMASYLLTDRKNVVVTRNAGNNFTALATDPP